MKAKLVILLITILFTLTGSTCINDSFLIALNVPIARCYPINAGPNLSYGGSATVLLINEIDPAYRDNLKGARYYDIRVKVEGTYNGSVAGTASINGIPLLNYSGTWATFSTAQSILGGSSSITPLPAGVAELARVLNQLPTVPGTVITLASSGQLAGQSPVPAGLSVCVEILTQVDAETTN